MVTPDLTVNVSQDFWEMDLLSAKILMNARIILEFHLVPAVLWKMITGRGFGLIVFIKFIFMNDIFEMAF